MNFLLFYTSLIISLLPGHFLRRFLLDHSKVNQSLSSIEKLVIDFGLGIFYVNFLFLSMNFLNISLSRKNILISLLSSCILLTILRLFKKNATSQKEEAEKEDQDSFNSLKSLSFRDVLIIILIIAFALLTRSMYISRGIMPQTTDMGHHMYWVNSININQALPSYGMPDFIIGEHILLSSVMILAQMPVIHFFPTLVLFTVNIFSLLAVFILAFRIFEQVRLRDKFAKKTAVLSLLFIGLFYAISSPQAKFVSGGVIGNIIGNFFIPALIYAFLMTIRQKSSSMSVVFFMFLFSIIYTHHLSTYIFIFSFTGFFVALVFFFLIKSRLNFKQFLSLALEQAAPFFSAKSLFLILLFAIFAFFVRTPSYLNASAIDTAVGTPEKATRTGYSVSSIGGSIGPWTFLYGILGLITLSWYSFLNFFKKNPFAKDATCLLIIFWFATIFIMSHSPQLLKVDIPSRRIVSYLSYPSAILAGFGVYWLIEKSKKRFSGFIFACIFSFILLTGFIAGFGDISESARDHDENREKEVYQTFLASEYTSKVAEEKQGVIKDHIYLAADSWIKLFFMRDYEYPLSRTFLDKYEDQFNPRETCTRDMIADPNSEKAIACYDQTSTKYVILKKGYDSAQFEKSSNFSKIFVTKNTVVFKRENF